MVRPLDPFRFVLIAVSGWMNQHQLQVIDYLREENRVLREQWGGRRLRFRDDQRRRLAAKAQLLGRRILAEVAIQRFSEDIDIFLDPLAFEPPLGKRAIDRQLKRLRDALAEHPALRFVEGESQTIGGFGRNDRFSYVQRFGGPGGVANRVILEAGTASGREPTTIVDITSYLGQFLRSKGLSVGAEDEGPFPMRLLHFGRTFVEKMFAIHGKVELYKRDGRPLGSYAPPLAA
jgi:hypothetical protein